MNEPPDDPNAAPPFAPPFTPPSSPWTVLGGVYYGLMVTASFASCAFLSVMILMNLGSHVFDAWSGVEVLCAFLGGALPVLAIVQMVRAYRRKTVMASLRNLYAFLVLAVMPVWGILVNHSLSPSCTLDGCMEDPRGQVRSLGEPGVFVLAGIQLAVVIAFAVSRRRPEALHPQAEPWLHATLLTGIIMHVLIAVQFGPDMIIGGMFFPLGGAAISPVLTVVLLFTELWWRLRRRGGEAAQPPPVTVAAPFREAQVHASPAPPQLHVRLLGFSLARVPVLLGVYAVVAAVVTHHRYGAVAAFTQTCAHTLSRIPLQTIPHGDCHYLCTVAARGHSWLARPERIGVRRGQQIVVNRQLAIANAFEDLLHERWPRFGALARRIYDKLGYPVSHLIRGPWLADAVLLLMKPAELFFYLSLLIADRRSPEERIGRMYK